MDQVEVAARQSMAGDRSAFESLYGRFSRPVLLSLLGLLGNREDAEDALQLTFVKAWRGIGRLRDARRFAPWLFRIARHTAHDLQRARQRGAQLDSAATEPYEHTLPPSDLSDVRRAIEALRPGERVLVLLRCAQGWSTDQVAEVLDIHPATVRRRYARALGRLRKTIERTPTT